MNETINIVGDIAGRFDELMLLLNKMPKADLILSVGDAIDRGKQSKEVIEYFINTPNTEVLYGNHEGLMFRYYEEKDDLWFLNGGTKTMDSFGWYIPEHYISWLKSRPLYYETDQLFVSHAPLIDQYAIPKNKYSRGYEIEDFIWNRDYPRRPYINQFMVYGHNGRIRKHEQIGTDGKLIYYAQCIDDSHNKRLCGLHWPTKELFFQDYLY